MRLIINIILSFVGRLSAYLFGELFYFLGLLLSNNRSKYHLGIGISFDKLLNVLGGPLFNIILRKRGGRRFGSHKETISAVLGYNKASWHLTSLGKLSAKALNKIEKDHVEKAVEYNEGTRF